MFQQLLSNYLMILFVVSNSVNHLQNHLKFVQPIVYMKSIQITVEKDKFILSLNLKSNPSNPDNPVDSKIHSFSGIAIIISSSFSTLIFLLVIHF